MTKWKRTLLIPAFALISLGLSSTVGAALPEKPVDSVPHVAPETRDLTKQLGQLVLQTNRYIFIRSTKDSQLVQIVKTVQLQETLRQSEAAKRNRSSNPVSVPSPTGNPQPTVGGRIPYDYGTWIRVHNCEQPETWHAGGHFGNGLPAGGNGLGFSLYAWQDAVRYAAHRGVTLPSSGWDASPDQQMQAAQAMLDATGGGPDCLGH